LRRFVTWKYPCFVFFFLAGCGGAVSSPDQPHLDAVLPFHPTYKLDNQGRVIQLELGGKNVTDKELDHVMHFSEIRHAGFWGASITDAGLEKLKDLKKIEALGLGNTLVTDKGLAIVAKMSSLSWVWYTESDKITPRGIAKLQKARPGLTLNKQ
jgi:hypothetical protein